MAYRRQSAAYPTSSLPAFLWLLERSDHKRIFAHVCAMFAVTPKNGHSVKAVATIIGIALERGKDRDT